MCNLGRRISSSRKTNIKGGPFDYFGGTLFNYYFQFQELCVPLHKRNELMKCTQDIYEAIAKDGFSESTLHSIDELVNQIENGSTDLPRFNLREHSGVCKAGPALIGASIVASYAERSLATGSHAGSGQGSPSKFAANVSQQRKKLTN